MDEGFASAEGPSSRFRRAQNSTATAAFGYRDPSNENRGGERESARTLGEGERDIILPTRRRSGKGGGKSSSSSPNSNMNTNSFPNENSDSELYRAASPTTSTSQSEGDEGTGQRNHARSSTDQGSAPLIAYESVAALLLFNELAPTAAPSSALTGKGSRQPPSTFFVSNGYGERERRKGKRRPNRFLRKLNDFFVDYRTERAFRFVSMLPICVYLAYYNPQTYNFGYLIAVFYLIGSALFPPLLAGIPFCIFLSFPFTVIGSFIGLALLEFAAGQYPERSPQVPDRDYMYMVLLLFIALTATVTGLARFGPANAILSAGLLSCLYSVVLVTITLIYAIEDGVDVRVPPAAFLQLLQLSVAELEKLAQSTSPLIAQFAAFILRWLINNNRICPILRVTATGFEILTADCFLTVPPSITAVHASLAPMVNEPLYVHSDPTIGLSVHLDLRKSFLRIVKSGDHELSFLKGLIASGAIGCAFYFAALILPPCRSGAQLASRRLSALLSPSSLRDTYQTLALLASGEERESPLQLADLDRSSPQGSDERSTGKFSLHSLKQRSDHKAIKANLPLASKQLSTKNSEDHLGHHSKNNEALSVPNKTSVALQLSQVTQEMLDQRVVAELTGLNAFSPLLFVATVEQILIDPVVRSPTFNGPIILGALRLLSLTKRTIFAEIPEKVPEGASEADRQNLPEPLSQTKPLSHTAQAGALTALAAMRCLQHVYRADAHNAAVQTEALAALALARERLKVLQTEFIQNLPKHETTSSNETSRSSMQESLAKNGLILKIIFVLPLQLVEAGDAYVEGAWRRRLQNPFINAFSFFLPSFLFIRQCLMAVVAFLLFPLGRIRSWRKKRERIQHDTTEHNNGHNNEHNNEHNRNDRVPGSGSHESGTKVAGDQQRLSQYLLQKSRCGVRAWYDLYEFWIVFRLTAGITAIMALLLYVPAYTGRIWAKETAASMAGDRPIDQLLSQIQLVNPLNKVAKTAGWTCLGFLTAYVPTAEGTLRRGLLRLSGVVVGSFSAWLCLLLSDRLPGAGTRNYEATITTFQIAWMVVTSFVAVFFTANRDQPLLGFRPSFGYGAQLFTYQQAIIILSVHNSANLNRDEVVVERLLSQIFGIAFAIAISWLIVPTRANRATRLFTANALHHARCFIESLIDTTRPTTPSQAKRPKNREIVDKSRAEQKKALQRHIDQVKTAVDNAGAYKSEHAWLLGLPVFPAALCPSSSAARAHSLVSGLPPLLESLMDGSVDFAATSAVEVEKQLENVRRAFSLLVLVCELKVEQCDRPPRRRSRVELCQRLTSDACRQTVNEAESALAKLEVTVSESWHLVSQERESAIKGPQELPDILVSRRGIILNYLADLRILLQTLKMVCS